MALHQFRLPVSPSASTCIVVVIFRVQVSKSAKNLSRNFHGPSNPRAILDNSGTHLDFTILEYARLFIGDTVVAYYGNETVSETISIFSRACVIIGVHGAGFANIVFSRPKTLAIEITVPSFRQKSNFTLMRSNEELIWNTEFMWHKYVVEWASMRQPSTYMVSFNRTNQWEFALHLDRVHIANILVIACNHLQTWFGIGLCADGRPHSPTAGEIKSKMQLIAPTVTDHAELCNHVSIVGAIGSSQPGRHIVPDESATEDLARGIPLRYSFYELAKWKFGEGNVIEIGSGVRAKDVIRSSCVIIKLAGEPPIDPHHLGPKTLILEIDRIPDPTHHQGADTVVFGNKSRANGFFQKYFVNHSDYDVFFKEFVTNSSYFVNVISDSTQFYREHVMNILRISCLHIRSVVGAVWCRNEHADHPAKRDFFHEVPIVLPTTRFVSFREFSSI